MSSRLIVREESVPGREGRVVLSRLLKASSAGFAPSSGIGVARYVSRARNTSSCLRISFAVRTARSAAPLDCGKCGLLVTWMKTVGIQPTRIAAHCQTRVFLVFRDVRNCFSVY